MLDRIPSKTFTAAGPEPGKGTAKGSIELGTLSKVVSLSFDFTGLPVGTETKVTDAITGANVLSYTGNTDQTFRPVAAANKAVGGAASALTEVAPVAERLKIEIAKGDPAGTLKVTTIIDSGFAV